MGSKEEVFSFLLEKAKTQSIVYYSDLSKEFGGVEQGFSNILNVIKEFCKSIGCPPLNYLVIQKDIDKHSEYLKGEEVDFLKSIHKIFVHANKYSEQEFRDSTKST